MRIILCLCLLLGIFNQAFSQQSIISGHIYTSDSISVLSGVAVLIEGSNIGSVSDANGRYSISNVFPGKHGLVISFLGFGRIEIEVDIAKSENRIIDFYLKRESFELPMMTIEGSSITGGQSAIGEIPGSAYYLSPKELQKFSYTDINRALRSVPGINLQEEDGFGLRPNIGLRGTGVERSSKITLMEDGILMAPAPYAAPAAYYFPTMGRMNAIEVLKGSSQIKYGPYTTGGAINLISTSIPNEFSGNLKLLRGSFGVENVHLNVGSSYEQVSVLVETFQYAADGFKHIDVGGNTGFVKKDYIAKVELKNKKEAKFQQSLLFKLGENTETSHETYLGLTEDDFSKDPFRRYNSSQNDLMETKHEQFSVWHNIKFSSELKLTSVAYQNNFSRNWYKLDGLLDSSDHKIKIEDILNDPQFHSDQYSALLGEAASQDYRFSLKANNRDYYSRGIQSTLSWNHSGKHDHNLQFGIRLHKDEADRYQWMDKYSLENQLMTLDVAGIPGTESNRIEKAKAIASFLQYRLIYKKLSLSPGIRYEHIKLERNDYGTNDVERTGYELFSRNNKVDAFIPGIGLSYKFNSLLNAFLGIHKGFSPPTSKSGAEPELSINYELGTRFNRDRYSAQFVLFYIDYQNLLGTDLAAAGGASTGDLFNAGEATVSGIELQYEVNLLASIPGRKIQIPFNCVYTFTNAHFDSDFESEFEGWGNVEAGDNFPYLAKHQFTVMTGMEHQYFNFNISGSYVDEMRTQPSHGDMLENQKTDAHFVLDGGATINVDNHISFFANMTNISNEVYIAARRPAGLRPGMPRAFNIGLKVSF